MDPRQPQHPFPRNSSSPYGRSPFTPSSNPPPSYPPTSHSPPAPSTYPDHQRRPSDPPYYNPPRGYGAETAPSHSRHQSASAIVQGSSVNRTMPPPSSPPQQTPQHGYGPPPPRAPPVSVGPPSTFPSGRELPSISSLSRPSSNSNGMSISSILGGPAPVAREQPAPQYGSPGPAPAASNSMYSGSTHASPRATTAASDYSPFRRPQTPDHQRPYEPREPQGGSAGSPTGATHYGTPDGRRYGTTPTYAQRQPPAEERREPARAPHTNTIPPRPSSQPNGFNTSAQVADSRPSMHADSLFSRRDNHPRPEPVREPLYPRNEYDDRHNSAYSYAERARQERDATIQREREQRDRAHNEHSNSMQQQDYAQRNAPAYNRAPEPREQPSWMRSGYEHPRAPPYEPIPEQQPQHREPIPVHEYSRSAATPYAGHSAYTPNEQRQPPTSHPQTIPPQHTSISASQYDTSMQERQRASDQPQQSMYSGPSQSASYHSQESPTRRPFDDSQQMQQQIQQRSLLGVQEMNRKGRVSPLPQAVQGAQGQIGGPGEPGIKSEFGRMFSGIGSGVGAMGVPSPVSSHQGLPNSGQLRREDLEGLQGQDSPSDKSGYGIPRSVSRGGNRRRKLKEEDGRGDDESSNGRHTPSGRGKRPKIHNHPHHHHHHQLSHHHHHHDAQETASSPSLPNSIPFKSIRGNVDPTPQDPKAVPALHHHHVPRHHHHHVTPTPKPAITPLPKITIRSKAVLDSVAQLPRQHLGHDYYKASLAPDPHVSARRTSQRGFASTPRPLPRFEGQENCTFTIRVPRMYLTPEIRAEITSRKAVWGTDIYTDDSDIIAACIHQGWFRGEWDEDVDTSLLGLELKEGPPDSPKAYLTEPPSKGPMHVLVDRDCHITILVLPLLEKYSSTTRFGLRSREWGGEHDGYKGTHDGLSFMIMSVRWVDGETDEGSRVIKRKLLLEGEREVEKADEAFFARIAGSEVSIGNADIPESFERGQLNGLPIDIKAIGTRSWFKASASTRRKKTASIVEKAEEPGKIEILQGDKPMEKVVMQAEGESPEKEKEGEQQERKEEPRQKSVIERVTERMIENANAHANLNGST